MKTNTPILKGVDPNLWSVALSWAKYSNDPSYFSDVFEMRKKKIFDAFDVTDNEFGKSEIIKKVIFNNNLKQAGYQITSVKRSGRNRYGNNSNWVEYYLVKDKE